MVAFEKSAGVLANRHESTMRFLQPSIKCNGLVASSIQTQLEMTQSWGYPKNALS